MSLVINGYNAASTSGNLTFLVEQCPFLASCLSEQEWTALGTTELLIGAQENIEVDISIISPISDGDAWKMNYRLVEYSNFVELDRVGLENLIVQESVASP